MESSFITFSPKRRRHKKVVSKKFTKLALQHQKQSPSCCKTTFGTASSLSKHNVVELNISSNLYYSKTITDWKTNPVEDEGDNYIHSDKPEAKTKNINNSCQEDSDSEDICSDRNLEAGKHVFKIKAVSELTRNSTELNKEEIPSSLNTNDDLRENIKSNRQSQELECSVISVSDSSSGISSNSPTKMEKISLIKQGTSYEKNSSISDCYEPIHTTLVSKEITETVPGVEALEDSKNDKINTEIQSQSSNESDASKASPLSITGRRSNKTLKIKNNVCDKVLRVGEKIIKTEIQDSNTRAISISSSSSDASDTSSSKIKASQNRKIVISDSSESESDEKENICDRKSVNSEQKSKVLLSGLTPEVTKTSKVLEWIETNCVVQPVNKKIVDNDKIQSSLNHATNNLTKSWRSPEHNSSSESEDNFDNFIQSIKKTNEKRRLKAYTPDSLQNFLTDGSGENSPGFYLSLTNKLLTEERLKKQSVNSKGYELKGRKVLKFDSDSESEEPATNIENDQKKKHAKLKDGHVIDEKLLSFSDGENSNTENVEPRMPTTSIKKDRKNKNFSPVVNSKNKDRVKGLNPGKAINLNKKLNIVNSTGSPLKTYSFLASLSPAIPLEQCHPDAVIYKKNFKKTKQELCLKLFNLYNKEVFEKKLPSDMSITWNVRLIKTAGLCYNKVSAVGRSARIELSVKVCDSADRLRDTLIHELCHAAVWLLDGIKSGHGYQWRMWALTAMRRFPELPKITRCHSYEITTKFIYKCVQCGYSIGRHSKSLDVEKKRCGYCLGKFQLFSNTPARPMQSDKQELKTPRTPSAFAVFVKENYSSVKKDRSDLKHGDVMKLLGQRFATIKISNSVTL